MLEDKQNNFSKQKWYSDFVEKTDFDDKLKSFNKTFTSNKPKHVEAEKKITDLAIKLHKHQKWDIIFVR